MADFPVHDLGAAQWDAWLDSYYERFRPAFEKSVYPKLMAFRDLALEVREAKAKMIFLGNGASASIASHGAVDFTKQAKVRSVDFNEPNFITAFANDFGFSEYMARGLSFYADPKDMVVTISVSGASPNVVRAAEYAREHGLKLVTFSGKSADNPLRKLGDVNFWIDSHAYNVVEAIHMLWMTTVVDMIVGRAEYSVS